MRSPISPTWWYAGIAAGLMLSAGVIAGCGTPPQDARPPAIALPDPAMRGRIAAFEAGDMRQTASMMAFRRADGRVFYLVNAPCCDHFNPLYDGDGRRICAPTGGFSGAGDGRCPAWVGPLLRGAPAAGKPTTAQGY